MSERTLLLGFDLGEEKSQMAVYDREKNIPVLIGQTEENPEGLIPTEIALSGEKPLRDFLVRIRRREDVVVDGKISKPLNMLSYFFRKTLSLTRKDYPGETIKQLVVTVRDVDREYMELIYAALEQLGIGRERAMVISHKQAFPYYVLNQKKELWMNDVGLFDYEGNTLTYYQMQVDRSKSPILVGVSERDYSGRFLYRRKIKSTRRPFLKMLCMVRFTKNFCQRFTWPERALKADGQIRCSVNCVWAEGFSKEEICM